MSYAPIKIGNYSDSLYLDLKNSSYSLKNDMPDFIFHEIVINQWPVGCKNVYP